MADNERDVMEALSLRVAALEAALEEFKLGMTSVNEVFGETLAKHDERLTALEGDRP